MQIVKCPRCRGEVRVPETVKFNHRLGFFQPLAECTRCLRRYQWTGSEWYCDRKLEAPIPREEGGSV